MSRIQHNGWLYHWDDEDNPGAGPKGEDSTGLNGQWYKIDVAVQTEHNINGTHKSNIIDKQHLKATVADGSTIEKDVTVGLRVRSGGISTQHIQDGAISQTKLATGAVGTNQLQDGAVTTDKIAAAAVTTATIQDDAVTPAKVPHDNNRTKAIFTCAIDDSTGDSYAKFHGVSMSATRGIPMPRAGSLTKVCVSEGANGTLETQSFAYGTKTFAANSQITVYWTDDQSGIYIKVVGGAVLATNMNPNGIIPMLVVLEVEFDDA